MRLEILIGGIGGQGVVYAASLIGKTATAEGKSAAAAAHYGPESRGSVTTSEVVISDEPIDYPYTEQPDIFIALHQAAYDKERYKIKPGGLIIVDSTLVNPSQTDNIRTISRPATQLARDRLNNITLANLILVGALVQETRLVSFAALERTLGEMTPDKMRQISLEALHLGLKKAEG